MFLPICDLFSTPSQLLLSHFIGHGESKGLSRFKGWRNRFNLLMGGGVDTGKQSIVTRDMQDDYIHVCVCMYIYIQIDRYRYRYRYRYRFPQIGIIQHRPFAVQASLLYECSKNPSVSCTSWHCCERLSLASVNFFKDSFIAFAYFMMSDL